MSDYFEGLAARGSGAATALRPRVMSAYETRDAMEVVEEAPSIAMRGGEVRAAERPGLASPGEPAAPADRVVVRDVVLTRTETRETPPTTIHDERAEKHVERVREHTREHTHHEERIERVHELLATVPERPAEARDDPGDGEVTAPPRRQPPTIAHVQPLEQRQQPSPSPIHRQPPSANRHPIAPPDPIIRITIGRVEVRAVQPAQPPPRPAPPPVAPGPTLEEFLEERERRK